MSNSSIPVIDISPLCAKGQAGATSEAHDVIAALTSAVLSHGIFAIAGHGIPLDLMTTTLEATKLALEEGGAAECECWAANEAEFREPGQLRNFSATGMESVGRLFTGKASAPKEPVAKFTVFPPRWDSDPTLLKANVWPPTNSGQALREPLEQYFAQAQRVSDALHLGLSQCLGQPRAFINESLTPHTDGLLRAMHYQRQEGGLEENCPAMAAHKDLGTTTLLLSDAPGLQFQPRGRDDWVDVVVPHGALIVNLGEFFEIWTGGAWRATPHRVAQEGRRGRTSLAFFSNQGIGQPCDGSAVKDRVIAPLSQVATNSASDVGTSMWCGIEVPECDDQKSIAWPAFFYERISGLLRASAGINEVEQASKGGA